MHLLTGVNRMHARQDDVLAIVQAVRHRGCAIAVAKRRHRA